MRKTKTLAELVFFVETTMDSLVSDWDLEISVDRDADNREEIVNDLRKVIEKSLLHEQKVRSKGVETKYQRTNDLAEKVRFLFSMLLKSYFFAYLFESKLQFRLEGIKG